MKLLPNGQVQITNNQTGEVRTVDPAMLGSYSPILANQYFAYMTAQKALNKASGGSSSGTDTGLAAPTNDADTNTATTNQNTPDLSGLAQFAKPVKAPTPQAPKIIITGLSGNNPTGNTTLVTQPVQTPQQQPKNPQKLSTFDVSKINFGG